VYYVNQDNQVNQLALSGGGWVDNPLPGTPAAPGSPLACFGANGKPAPGWAGGGTDSRVYYLNPDGRVAELAWRNGGWQVTLA
jgi:hypothetical protein